MPGKSGRKSPAVGRSDKGRKTRFSDVEVGGQKQIRPTADILDALERDYPLEASVADLVDNSIDARARNVLIRFIRDGRTLVSLCVVDDGAGIPEKDADRAMGFAAKRTYGQKDLGMFGVGLKTASLSQAECVVVVSRAAGRGPVGRRWTKSGIKKHDWLLDLLTTGSARQILEHRWGALATIRRGTVVRWDSVYDFQRLQSGIDEYLEKAMAKIGNHLGLKLHRFLQRRQVRIQIDVEDVSTGEVGPPSYVSPMNPFPQDAANRAGGFPKDYVVSLPDAGKLKMRAYVWRKRSRDEGYRLGGGRVVELQGFYFFRHDRLIQDGGWSGVLTIEHHLSLARVEIDIPDHLRGYLKVQSNKARVDVPGTFGPAAMAATARDGSTFAEYLKRADEIYRKRKEQQAKPMVTPGSGVPAVIRKALERQEMRFLRGPKCSVIWERLNGHGFIHVDQEDRRIVLNSRYRKELLRGAHGGSTDLPLLRTLLYFVFESLLAGERIGPVERKRLHAIQAAMNEALKLEREWAAA
jgi:hypothetical protein